MLKTKSYIFTTDLKRISIILICAIGIFGSCNNSRFVEPLRDKQFAVGFDGGGPLIDYGGSTIPLPFTTINAGYGIDSTLTAFAGIHTTSLAFDNIQLDFGVTKEVLKQNNYYPGISISPSINIIKSIDYKAANLWPIIDANAFWTYGPLKNLAYAGISNWFILASNRAHEQTLETNWLLNYHIGHGFKLRKGFQINTEIKIIAPKYERELLFVPWKSIIPNKSATGVYLGVIKKF